MRPPGQPAVVRRSARLSLSPPGSRNTDIYGLDMDTTVRSVLP